MSFGQFMHYMRTNGVRPSAQKYIEYIILKLVHEKTKQGKVLSLGELFKVLKEQSLRDKRFQYTRHQVFQIVKAMVRRGEIEALARL